LRTSLRHTSGSQQKLTIQRACSVNHLLEERSILYEPNNI